MSSFLQYDSRRGDLCLPAAAAAAADHVVPSSRDFRQQQQQQQHGGTVNPNQPYGRPNAAPSFKSGAAPFVDRLSYMPMSTTSGFDPTAASSLPYPPFPCNFDAMHAAAELSAGGGVGGSAQLTPPEVDFRAAMTSSDGYPTAADGVSGLQRFTDYRAGAMTTAAAAGVFLSPDRTAYVNGATVLPVSANSAPGVVRQQMSPPSSATTPTSPTTIVYPWMTIVGQLTFLRSANLRSPYNGSIR